MKKLLLIIGGVVLATSLWFIARSPEAVQVPFSRAIQKTLVSEILSNGKVEPENWISVRAELAGRVERIQARNGDRVKKGQILVSLSDEWLQPVLAAAKARLKQAETHLQELEQGGPAVERQRLKAELERLELELKQAGEDYRRIVQLHEENAATRQELENAKFAVDKLSALLRSTREQYRLLADPLELEKARAQLDETQAHLREVLQKLEKTRIRAPTNGLLSELGLKPGDYVDVGQEVARIGQLDELVVRIYIDEPDLGKVRPGMPVEIHWDGFPGRKWQAKVDRVLPGVEVIEARNVGIAIAYIENPDEILLPEANVTAKIQVAVMQNAIVVPREALRQRAGHWGVFVLEGDRVRWRRVEPGIMTVNEAEIRSGLSAGEAVALLSSGELSDGQPVRPYFVD